ncbi:ABC transporter permease subunit [Cytobacillus purgationiresistens]|uniref:Autoinducer 2 import system permease protein LsrC n=1 Tax=Cytobacillus purgationiresistens TaxID=863449 RepID=A0ABU0AFG5_9BACI|nr:sugar ABC transporter permease [Cytobacillus purgationiresistens]MDQ0269178.1 AI-2 transport system permease protein [Cytobacillus purgationiresistens]
MKKLLIKSIQVREISIVILLIAFFLLVGSINQEFIKIDSITLLVSGSIILLVMAIGQSFVLLTANIDVSVGSIMGISAAVCGSLLVSGLNVWVVVITVMAVGAFIGLINGLGVSYLRIPSIIMTLGMLGIVRGAMLLYTEGMWIEAIPNDYKRLSNTEILFLPLPIWIGFVVMIIAYLFLTKTKKGRYFYAVGDNEEGARLVGIPVRLIKVLAFIISGMSASIAGLVFVMNIGFVPNTTGSGIELEVIAAAVLGGVSLSGGLGTVVGAGLGAVFFTVINQSLVYMKIPAYWNSAISGFLLLMIVIGDTKFQSYLKRKSRHHVKEKSNDGGEEVRASDSKNKAIP